MTIAEETHTVSSNVADPQPTSKRRELVDIFVAEVAEKSKSAPNVLFSHLEISSAIGIPYILNGRTNPTYQGWVQYAKKRLIAEHGLFLDSVTSVGYALKEPGDEIEVCKKKFNRGVKNIFDSLKQANRIRLEKIPVGEKLDRTIAFTNEASNKAGLLRQSQITA